MRFLGTSLVLLISLAVAGELTSRIANPTVKTINVILGHVLINAINCVPAAAVDPPQSDRGVGEPEHISAGTAGVAKLQVSPEGSFSISTVRIELRTLILHATDRDQCLQTS